MCAVLNGWMENEIAGEKKRKYTLDLWLSFEFQFRV
jgi:hypothetical protein